MLVSTAVDPSFRPPESYQWNLTVSHELLQDTVLEASYIGNHGLHIWRRNVNRNDIAPNQACRRQLRATAAIAIRSTSDRASCAGNNAADRLPMSVIRTQGN